MPKKILVTGGAGYIGYYVIQKLLEETRSKVVVLDSLLYESKTLDEFKANNRLALIQGDIRNIADLVTVIKGTDVVIALAAIVGDTACALNKEQTLSSNYHSTDLLIQICKYYNVKRLVFASSCSVYGAEDIILNEGSKVNPLSLYAETRVMSEELIKKNCGDSLESVILRFGTVFGWSRRMRFDLAVNFLTAKAFFTKEIDIIGGDQWRPFVHVQDVARAVLLSSFAKKEKVAGEIFNVGGNRLNIQIKKIAEDIKKHIKNVKVNHKKLAPADRRNYRVSFDKIEHVLGFKPRYSLGDGISEIITQLKSQKISYLDDKYYNVKYLYKHFNS